MNMDYFVGYKFQSNSFSTMLNNHPTSSIIPFYNTNLNHIFGYMQRNTLTDLQRKWLIDASHLMPILEKLGICSKNKLLFNLENYDFYTFIFNPNVSLPRIASAVGICSDSSVLNTVFNYSYKKELEIAEKYLKLLKSADTRSIEFNLSLSDVAKLLERKTCFYTKATFSLKDPSLLRTIDRIDCNKGYVKGNVVACIHAANQLKCLMFESKGSKMQLTPKMLINFANKIHDIQKEV